MYKRFRAESLACKGRFGFVGEHVIDKPILYGIWCGEVIVAVGVFHDALQGLTGVANEDVVDATAQAQDFACGDLDIGSLTFCPTERLMDQHGLPFVPAVSSTAPILMAMPTQMVETSGLIHCMVS